MKVSALPSTLQGREAGVPGVQLLLEHDGMRLARFSAGKPGSTGPREVDI